MYKSILFLGICSSFASGSKLPVPDNNFGKIINCHYNSDQEFLSKDPKETLHIDHIDASLCTHITYSYIEFNADASVESDIVKDHTDEEFKRFNDLRKKKPHLKTLVTLGASEDYSMNSTEVVTNPTLREKLVNNIVEFVKKYEFNGFDINWHFPARSSENQVKAPSDKQNFVLLLKALREKFDEEGVILSVTVSAIEEIAKISYNIEEISKYVDFINLQTYDFYDYNEPGKKVTHNTPMYPSSEENAEERKLNIDYAVKYWISQGAPPRKLILGTSFYGIVFTLANPNQVGRGAPSDGVGRMGELGRVPECYQIGQFRKNLEWRYLYDKEQQVPYIYKDDLILAYDDVESIKKKAEYAKKMNLGGVFAWTIDQDDFNGDCNEKFPLLKTLNRVLGYK